MLENGRGWGFEKTKKIMILMLIIVCFIVAVFVIKKIEKDSIDGYLKGTYTSKQLPFHLFSFDTRDNHTFSYYEQSPHTKAVERKGTFYKKSKNVFVLESEYFNGTEVFLDKDNGFLITINNQEYHFIRLGRNPTIIELDQ
jgi:uncharacterized protein YxeA